MKNPFTPNLILSSWITLSVLTTAQAQPQNQNLKPNAKLQAKLNEKFKTNEGLIFRYTSPANIEKAAKNLGGNNIQVDFGSGNKIHVEKSTGGTVTIGSGADGLIANSSASVGSPLVVPIPLQPKMSITVVGGGKGTYFCVYELGRNDDGTYRHWSIPEDSRRICANTGLPARLDHPGTFLVRLYGPTSIYSSATIVEVADGENKLVPIREIVVPKTATESQVNFALYRDFESSKIEQEKEIIGSFAGSSLVVEPYYLSSDTKTKLEEAKTIEEYAKFFKLEVKNDQFLYGIPDVNDSKQRVLFYYYRFNYSLNDDDFKRSAVPNSAKEDYTFYVLPGVYGIAWIIDGQVQRTKGLYVQ